MNAIVSGQNGMAMILDGEHASMLNEGPDEPLRECHWEDFPRLFGDADDLEFLENVDLPKIVDHLAEAFAREQALQLTLVLLDNFFSHRTRRSAGKELESLIGKPRVERFVENVLSAHVLPAKSDLLGALSCIPRDAPRARKLLENLWANQGHIAAVQRAWEALPTRLFGGEKVRSQVRTAAIRAGLFRGLVWWRAGGRVDPNSLEALAGQPPIVSHDLASVWIAELQREDRFSAAESELEHHSDENEIARFVAENSADREQAIELVYEELRKIRARIPREPDLFTLETQWLAELRRFQRLEARDIIRRHKSKPSLPRNAWKVVAQAQRLLNT
ncbi:MAG TPA: hypothetical protein VLX28_15505 [Thermoanaerobaculia bacterium]|nr:hypothetical protein [Thermoanaerobaculia bacterium]